jgi:hypothetical protein
METCALKEGREAVCDGGVVIGEEDGGRSRDIKYSLHFDYKRDEHPLSAQCEKMKGEKSLVTWTRLILRKRRSVLME